MAPHNKACVAPDNPACGSHNTQLSAWSVYLADEWSDQLVCGVSGQQPEWHTSLALCQPTPVKNAALRCSTSAFEDLFYIEAKPHTVSDSCIKNMEIKVPLNHHLQEPWVEQQTHPDEVFCLAKV